MAKRKAAAKSSGRGRRGSSRGAKGVLGVLAVVFGLLGVTGFQYYRDPASLGLAPPSAEAETQRPSRNQRNAADDEGFTIIARVQRVVDGDTLVVEYEGKEERVRLINVDTPESVHADARKNTVFGKVAADFTRAELEGSQIRLEGEPGKAFDTFGRRLAYVYRNGDNFNLRLIREGYSPYYTKFGKSMRYDAEFSEAEREARSLGRGIWAE